eukprot:GHVN01075866.1.p1 GENE.GHVN01075866.1~~GHVN01075866.1.p1  ORF type:complete len:331 (-),score=46.42 GHVN01075866.1:1504-2496(-)
MALLSWAAMFAPKLSLMFLLVLRLYEFLCLLWFWELMIDILDGPDSAYRILSTKEPRYVLKVFPCCLIPFIYSKRRLRKRDISISWWCVAQYGPVNVVSILSVALSSHLQSFFTGLSTVSLILCMHGLFIIYAASHKESLEFRLTFKFIVIKSSVMIVKGVEVLVRIPGVVKPYPFPYNEALMGMAWLCLAMNIASLIYTVLATFAFPAKDVTVRLDKHIEIEKLKIHPMDAESGLRTQNDEELTEREEELLSLSPSPRNKQDKGGNQENSSDGGQAVSTARPSPGLESEEGIEMAGEALSALSPAVLDVVNARVLGRETKREWGVVGGE